MSYFGNGNIESYKLNCEDQIIGGVFTAPETNSAAELGFYIDFSGGGATHTVKAALYEINGATASFVAEGQEKVFVSYVDGWYTFPLGDPIYSGTAQVGTAYPNVSSGQSYAFCIFSNKTSGVSVDTRCGYYGTPNKIITYAHPFSAGYWPTTFVPSNLNGFKLSSKCELYH